MPRGVLRCRRRRLAGPPAVSPPHAFGLPRDRFV